MDEESKEQITVCPDCGSTDLSTRDGERFCKKCGLVIED